MSVQWFVMRDLRRPNAKVPTYKQLEGMGIEVFTPLLRRQNSKQEWVESPLVYGLFFVHDTREHLDPIVDKIPTLQYRFLPKRQHEPMVVPNTDMERFICAVNSTGSPHYYLPEEVSPQMYGRKIRMVGGSLHGLEGRLLTKRGSKTKRLLVELPGFLSVSVEVNPDYIQFLKEK